MHLVLYIRQLNKTNNNGTTGHVIDISEQLRRATARTSPSSHPPLVPGLPAFLSSSILASRCWCSLALSCSRRCFTEAVLSIDSKARRLVSLVTACRDWASYTETGKSSTSAPGGCSRARDPLLLRFMLISCCPTSGNEQTRDAPESSLRTRRASAWDMTWRMRTHEHE